MFYKDAIRPETTELQIKEFELTNLGIQFK